MVGRTSDWKEELGHSQAVSGSLGRKARRQMRPLYVSGLIGPGDRKSIQPMAKRLALGECDQLHHFIAAGERLWKQNCLSKRTGSSAAAMPCWLTTLRYLRKARIGGCRRLESPRHAAGGGRSREAEAEPPWQFCMLW